MSMMFEVRLHVAAKVKGSVYPNYHGKKTLFDTVSTAFSEMISWLIHRQRCEQFSLNNFFISGCFHTCRLINLVLMKGKYDAVLLFCSGSYSQLSFHNEPRANMTLCRFTGNSLIGQFWSVTNSGR